MRKRSSAVVAVLAVTLAGCGVFDSKHVVGECVHTRATFGGTEIVAADCPASAFDKENLADPVYRISHVLDIDGHCPVDGKPGVELKHEPDDAVYCLEMAGI